MSIRRPGAEESAQPATMDVKTWLTSIKPALAQFDAGILEAQPLGVGHAAHREHDQIGLFLVAALDPCGLPPHRRRAVNFLVRLRAF